MSLRTSSFNGIVYRAHHPAWAFDPLSGDGAAKFGGRFNPVGTPALYTSLSMKTAWLEAQQGFAFKAQPLTLCAYDVACVDVLDLSSTATLDALKIDSETLSCPWEKLSFQGSDVPTWQLMDRLVSMGVSAIIVPSYAPGAPGERNLVFWSWSSDPPHQVRVIDDQGRLPRDQSSWQ